MSITIRDIDLENIDEAINIIKRAHGRILERTTRGYIRD